MTEYIERKKIEEAFDNADPDVCESDLDGHSDWGFGREIVRTAAREWTVMVMRLINADRLSKSIYENVSAVCKCQNE